ncbi:Uncharacterized protein TCM_014326 [Theobroma cacao]|uniref:Uncharacterized protein n=1 Tax=Theobroma cacao TaxID=3641 RepID=A0A061FXY5_THECC|nr:Uncharacterized protein TCM_014326 [Theobroma cacao]
MLGQLGCRWVGNGNPNQLHANGSNGQVRANTALFGHVCQQKDSCSIDLTNHKLRSPFSRQTTDSDKCCLHFTH